MQTQAVLPPTIKTVSAHQTNTSGCSIGERIAAGFFDLTPSELEKALSVLEADALAETVDLLAQAERVLSARHAVVAAVLVRISDIGKPVVRPRLRAASAPSATFYAALAEYNAAYDHMIEGNARNRSDAELDADMKRHIETSIALVQTAAHGPVAAAALLSIALARILEGSPYDLATIQPEALNGCDMDACDFAFIVSALRALSARGAD